MSRQVLVLSHYSWRVLAFTREKNRGGDRKRVSGMIILFTYLRFSLGSIYCNVLMVMVGAIILCESLIRQY